MIRQALEGITGGPYEKKYDRSRTVSGMEWNDFHYRFISSQNPLPTLELAKQELYVRVEAPKGELGIF